MKRYDIELRRLNETMESLTQEEHQVEQQIARLRSDEEYEIQYIRQKFSGKAHSLEAKDQQIKRDIQRRRREVAGIEQKIEKQEAEEKRAQRLDSRDKSARKRSSWV